MSMKNRMGFGLAFLLMVTTLVGKAQTAPPARHKIALFAPLFLDSAFDAADNYRFSKTFPKFLNPGLEFYQGAQAAFDSLEKAGAPLEVFVYDTRAKNTSVAREVAAPELSNVEMIFAHANTAEVKTLAEAAQKKKVPFISATLPSDANITNNPFYVVLNPTLRTHIEGVYKYLQQYHRNDRIIIFNKTGAQENQIKLYIEEFGKATTTKPLKLQFHNIGSNFNAAQITGRLDTLQKTVCIAGSLNEGFGLKLAQTLASVSSSYPVTLVGMPTWDGFTLTKPEFKNMEIVYSTPFNYGKWNPLQTQLSKAFETEINSRPTDMYFRGYETVLRFTLLLLDAKQDVASSLSRNGNYVFTEYDVQPVLLNAENMTLDYFENKKLYFTRIINGIKTVQ